MMNNLNMWFVLAQVFGIGTMVFEFICYQVDQDHEKSKYFLFTGIGSIFWALMFISIGMATGMATQISLIVAGTYSAFRNLVFFGVFKRDTPASKKFGRRFLIAMMPIVITAGVMGVLQAPSEIRWIHIFGMVTALLFVVGQYLPGNHYVRIAIVFYATAVLLTQTPLNILYGDFRWNIMGILIESTKIVSVFVFYALQVIKAKRARDLELIKHVIAEELSKIEELAGKIPVTNLPAVSRVEKLMAKMVKSELKMVTTARMKDVESTEDELQALIDDLQMLQRMKRVQANVVA